MEKQRSSIANEGAVSAVEDKVNSLLVSVCLFLTQSVVGTVSCELNKLQLQLLKQEKFDWRLAFSQH